MKVRFLFLLSFTLFFSLISVQAGATALNLELSTNEYLSDLTFYLDGTHTCGNITGCLSITNPSFNQTVSSVDINFCNGVIPSHAHINEIKPNCTAVVSYEFESSKISLPVITETITPSFLFSGLAQELVFEIGISNPGCADIQILQFKKNFPTQLKLVNYTLSAGTLSTTCNSFQWENLSVSPGCRENLRIVFTVVPISDLIFPSSNVSFTTPASEISKNFYLSAVTNTRFAVEKQRLGAGVWKVGVIVEDASEFDFLLYNVQVYVSDTMLNEPKLIKDYCLSSCLTPGDCWKGSFIYMYPGTPVFFAKIYFTIPYVLDVISMPLNATGNGSFVINSTVSEKKTHPNSGNNRRLKIITPTSPLPENISVRQSALQVDENSQESSLLPENRSFRNSSSKTESVDVFAKEENKISRVLLLIILLFGVFSLAGRKILSFLFILLKK